MEVRISRANREPPGCPCRDYRPVATNSQDANRPVWKHLESFTEKCRREIPQQPNKTQHEQLVYWPYEEASLEISEASSAMRKTRAFRSAAVGTVTKKWRRWMMKWRRRTMGCFVRSDR
ncbi:unnamed protein product [Nesidiocoris tenuis]|uniref:Uncharacterized protein n=1 Tax=Nesidiocoris tenuis TaxID=355587 RepID=A0A6H5HHZ0_9HEMI|nr:unnamed protein product [Nesidiocoris tenuis]